MFASGLTGALNYYALSRQAQALLSWALCRVNPELELNLVASSLDQLNSSQSEAELRLAQAQGGLFKVQPKLIHRFRLVHQKSIHRYRSASRSDLGRNIFLKKLYSKKIYISARTCGLQFFILHKLILIILSC